MSCIRTADTDSPRISSPPPQLAAAADNNRFRRALRRLGCASSALSDAYAPAAAAVRSSAEWRGKRSRRRSLKQKGSNSSKRERRDSESNHNQSFSSSSSSSSSAIAAAAADVVWCGPGFSDDSVDCVVRHHAMMMMMDRGGRHDAERIHREGSDPSIVGLVVVVADQAIHSPTYKSIVKDPAFEDVTSRWSSESLSHKDSVFIKMFQTSMVSGRMAVYDRYRDWRLDVDRMSYEELLELGDRIGYVNTGLREEEISRSLRKMKHSILDASPLYFSTEMEKKCSICQEEYEVNDEMGKLQCGHSYHMYCIKQWLLQKNACPVCKTAVTKT